MKWTSEKIAGVMYILPALAVLPMWYILFFLGNPPNPNYREMFAARFIDDPHRGLFWYHAILPLICVIFAVAYLSNISKIRFAVGLLCVAGGALAISAWLMSNEAIAIFVTLPLFFAVQAAWHLTNRSIGP